MISKHIRCSLFFLLVFFSPADAQEFGVLPEKNQLEEIFNRPDFIKTEVSREIEEDKSRWIDAFADIHAVVDIPMKNLRETIMDFESYPKIFRRNNAIQVVRENGLLFHDMTAGIEVMGISYFIKYRVRVTEIVNTEDRLILDFNFVSGDGKIKSMTGGWHFEKLGGTGRCYVRYFASSRVIQRFPLQGWIMSVLINPETKDAMTQFLATARKRR